MLNPTELPHWRYATRWERVGLRVLAVIRPVLYPAFLIIRKYPGRDQ